MIGLLERVLRDRYGEPAILVSGLFREFQWNTNCESRKCVLYKPNPPGIDVASPLGDLGSIYGDAVGGFFLLNALKVAMLEGPNVFGLYKIDELQAHPAVRYANTLDPAIAFFMDASNEWYYGVNRGELYVLDSAFKELHLLGGAHSQLHRLLEQWEEANSNLGE